MSTKNSSTKGSSEKYFGSVYPNDKRPSSYELGRLSCRDHPCQSGGRQSDLEGQILDHFLDRCRLGGSLLARVQEQHLLSAHKGLVALLAAFAILPRLGVQA